MGHLHRRQPGAHGELVARGGHGVGWVVAEPELGRGLRGDEGAPVVDGDHGVDGEHRVVGHDDSGRLVGVAEGDLERASPHELTQGVSLLGADDDLDPQRTSRVEEVPGPVCRRGDEEE